MDTQGAQQQMDALIQQGKQLYQILSQVKSVFSDMGLGGAGGAAGSSGGGAFFGGASGAAQASASAPGINLAGAGGNANWLIAALSGASPSSQTAMNPSLVAGLLASTQAGGQGGPLPMRNALGQFIGAGGGAGNGGGAASNPLNPFGGAPAMGASSSIGPQYQNLYNTWQAGQQADATLRYTAFGVAAHGASQIGGAYTQSVVSGAQNAMGYGGAYGGVVGGMAGAVVGNMILPGFGGVVGAGLGASLGSSAANAFQAPANARYTAATMVGGYAASVGQPAMAMAMHAQDDASAVNNTRMASLNTRGNFHDFIEGNLRTWGLYQGVDQTSTLQTAQTEAALGGAYLQNGVSLSDWAVSAMGRRMGDKYGANAPAVAESMGKAIGNLNASGNNMTDLALRVGITPTVTFLRDRGEQNDADRLVAGIGIYQATEHRYTGAESVAQGARADYEASRVFRAVHARANRRVSGFAIGHAGPGRRARLGIRRFVFYAGRRKLQ